MAGLDVTAHATATRGFLPGMENHLPDVFSLTVLDDALIGRAAKGDVITVSKSRRTEVSAGDGVLIRTANSSYMLRIYQPKEDGSYLAVATNPNFLPWHSVEDGLEIVGVVIGTPSCCWAIPRGRAQGESA